MDKEKELKLEYLNTDSYSPKWVLRIKSTVRPFLTYIFTFLYVYIVIKHDAVYDKYVSGLNTIMVTIIIFWFGERLLRNVGVVDFLKSFRK